MATEKGIVIKANDTRAWVKTEKSSACEGCSYHDSCGESGGGREMEVEAINRANAKTGDLVMISFGTAPLIKVYSLVYIFPILALLAGAVLGQWLSDYVSMDESLLSLIFGLLFFGVAFFIIKFRSNRMAQREDYQPVIFRILSAAKTPPV